LGITQELANVEKGFPLMSEELFTFNLTLHFLDKNMKNSEMFLRS